MGVISILDLDKLEQEFNNKKIVEYMSPFALEFIPKLIEELRNTRVEVVKALLKSE